MNRAKGGASIAFGLVSVPVKLAPRAVRQSIASRRLHGSCHTPLAAGDRCPKCARLVEDVVHGYEVLEDEFVTVTDDDLAACEIAKADSLEIREFVPATEITPDKVRSTEIVTAGVKGDRSVALLTDALERRKVAAVGELYRLGRAELVALRVSTGVLFMHVLFRVNELRDAMPCTYIPHKFSKRHRELADHLVRQRLRSKLDVATYRDEYADNVRDMIERKVAAFVERRDLPPNVVDLDAFRREHRRGP